MKTKPRRFRTKAFQAICGSLIATAGFFLSPEGRADGCFVAPKFVWDKHKDINEPTQKAIIAYNAGHEDLILQVKYGGPVEEFGWLVPVPALPTVKEGSMECFYELSKYTQELWEPRMTHGRGMEKLSAAGLGVEKPEAVKVIEIKTVGAYEVAVLSATDADALKNWLKANQFSIPQDKADVIESYVKKGWYFVTARINLGKTTGFIFISGPPKTRVSAKSSLEEKLSSGELRPLHLSFASDRCVFPLKISSVNGRPSEVQVYVLSPEPLLEKGMFEKQLPEIYSKDMAQAQRNAKSLRNSRLFTLRFSSGNTNLPLSAEIEKEIKKIRETPRVSGELPHYVEVTKKELPDYSREIGLLAEKSCWLTKQTWTFRPAEMRDLEFEPAVPVLAGKLDSPYGYYTAACLAQFGTTGMWPLIEGLQGSNRVVRTAVISAFESSNADTIRGDPTFQKTVAELTKDPDPELRAFVVRYVSGPPEFLIAAMHDEDFKVAGLAGATLMQTLAFRPEGKKYIPVVQEMLHDKNLVTREAAIEALGAVRVTIPRADLLQFFKVPNLHVVADACRKLEQEGEDVSNEDVIPLLQNSDPSVRAFGLKVLYENVGKSSVDLALPLLKDSEQLVRGRACDLLADLTGQNIPVDQPGRWEKWWAENKTTFVLDEEQVHQRRMERLRERTRFPTRWDIPDGP